MVCDLNGFKINDRFGHLEGNRILKLFARSLQGSCRDYDYVARMGGDEFVIVAPGLSLPAAAARRICLSEMGTAAGRTVCGEDLLSLSVGCAVFPHDGSDAEKLLAEADRRMYGEKQQHYGEKQQHYGEKQQHHSEKQAVRHSITAINASQPGMDSVPSPSV